MEQNSNKQGKATPVILCWNCKKPVETTGMNCPHCNVFIDKEMMDRIKTTGTSESAHSRIRVGVVVAKRYEIKKEIGRGGMGVVYRAHDNYMDRDVALKLIPPELSMDPKAISDLKQETSLALDLTHEHIVRLYNLDNWQNLMFVTMEYVPCGTLSHLMVEKGGKLSLKEALPLLKQTSQALDYAHEKNPPVVHLDLKPLNILLTMEGCAKIGDYGLARVLRDLATRISAWEAAGTLAYMAPEQIRGKDIGPWTDIYELAAVAYELLSGHPPFYTGDLRWQIMYEEVEPIKDLPEHINNALLSGLAKDKSQRPQNAGDFVKMLEGKMPAPTIEVKKQFSPQPKVIETPKKEKKKFSGFLKTGFLLVGIIAFCAALVFGWMVYSGAPRLAFLSGTGFRHPKKVLEHKGEISLPKKRLPQAAVPAGIKAAGVIKGTVQKGTLEIRSFPSGSQAVVDGLKKGLTPIELKNMTKGIHHLVLTKEGFDPWEGDVEIKPSNHASVDAQLKSIYVGLSITSSPKDASVYVDGAAMGKTPVTLRKIKKGPRKIEVKKSGFHTWEKNVLLKQENILAIAANLKPSLGDLKIISYPKKAKVFINGKKWGTTPLVVNGLNEGKTKIKILKDCYEPVKSSIQVIAGKLQKNTFKLRPACGTLAVKSTPKHAKWFFDGKYVGTTPGAINKLKKGRHRLKITKPSFSNWERSITVSPGKTQTIFAKLKSLSPRPGEICSDPLTGMEFVWVKKGCFTMGASEDSTENDPDEKPAHEACVNSFWMGKYEVTQAQWKLVMGNNPSSFAKGGNYPVENISWMDVKAFIEKLNDISKGESFFRLPTEAEWEYASRAGNSKDLYSGGNTLDKLAWYRDNSGKSPHPVGQKAPNHLGIFDMSGNLFEWVEDTYDLDAYKSVRRNNPLFNKGDQAYKVCRGGSWLLRGSECRITNRSYYPAASRNYNLGFRIVKNP